MTTQQDIPDLIAGALGVSRGTAYDLMREALAGAQQQSAERGEPLAKVVSTAPESIWLDLGFDPEIDGEISFDDLFEATWSHDNATGNGIEYVRADLAPPRKPLLASDIVTMYDENPRSDSEMIAFARAIEAAHGIKGEA